MAIPLTINGVTFQYPQQFDQNWGPTLTNWSSAVTTGMLQKAGGTFTLTAEVNFGSSFGLLAPYFKSSASNIATTGVLRLANASSGVVWRNQLNNADLALTVNSSNQLTFNGVSIGATTSLTDGHILVGDVANQPADVAMSGDVTIANTGVTAISSGVIVNADVNASAAIALSKLAALTASRVPVLDGSGFLTASSVTATTLTYLDATSSIQTQLNTLTSSLGSYLPLAGGTMAGPINMGSNKITSLTQGTNTGEAISVPAGTAQIDNSAITTTLIAANAVTQVSATGTNSGSTGSTLIASRTITTVGGPVLCLASVTYTSDSAGSPQRIFVRTSVRRGTTNILGGDAQHIMTYAGAVTGQYFIMPTMCVDSPAAGTYTYNFEYDQGAGSGAVSVYSFSVVELKR